VPIPAQPGLYKLIVAARAPAGQVVSDTLVLDARRGVRLEASAPQWLTVGDRSLVAVRVENAYVEPIQAQVRCEVGDSLHAERPCVEVLDLPARPAPGCTWTWRPRGRARAR